MLHIIPGPLLPQRHLRRMLCYTMRMLCYTMNSVCYVTCASDASEAVEAVAIRGRPPSHLLPLMATASTASEGPSEADRPLRQ